MFSLIFAWTNGWVNNWDAGDLRRDGAHYDVTVIIMYTHTGLCSKLIVIPTFTQRASVWAISIQIWLEFVLSGLIDNEKALVQVMAWRRTGDKS